MVQSYQWQSKNQARYLYSGNHKLLAGENEPFLKGGVVDTNPQLIQPNFY